MPGPPSFMRTFGHVTTAAMPRRHVASTSSSRLAYGPPRIKPPLWFEIIVHSGSALAKAANSGNREK
jgi:hypothetical protein